MSNSGAEALEHTVLNEGNSEEVDAGMGCDDVTEVDEKSSDDASSDRTFFFGPSNITEDTISEFEKRSYFDFGLARAPSDELEPKPVTGEAVVFEEFFIAGLRMPPHPRLAEYLTKFNVELHQLTPNVIVQS